MYSSLPCRSVSYRLLTRHPLERDHLRGRGTRRRRRGRWRRRRRRWRRRRRRWRRRRRRLLRYLLYLLVCLLYAVAALCLFLSRFLGSLQYFLLNPYGYKYIPPQVKGQPRSNRVDGLSLTEPEEEDAYATRDFHGQNNTARQPTMNFNKLNNEVLCWNCLGWGHTKQRCPSSKIPRSMADAHHIFEQRLARDAQQHPEQAARRRPLGRGSQRRPPTAMATDEINKDKNWNDEDDQEEELAAATAFSHDVTFSSTEDAALGLHLEIDEPASTNVATILDPALLTFRIVMRRWKDGLLWVILTLLVTQSMSPRVIPHTCTSSTGNERCTYMYKSPQHHYLTHRFGLLDNSIRSKISLPETKNHHHQPQTKGNHSKWTRNARRIHRHPHRQA